MDWWDRDIELIFIQFKDVPFSYSVELGSTDETVDDIKEKLRKEFPNGRHLKPHETLVYKNQELKDGHLLADYHLPKNTLLYVAERNTNPSSPENLQEKEEEPSVPSSPKNLEEKDLKEKQEGPWDLGVIQSVKHKQLLPVDLLPMDEPFYDNPFIKPKQMYVNTNSTVKDGTSTTRVCDKRVRMSPPPNAVGSNAIEIVAHETTRVCDKRARMSPPPNAVGSNAIEIVAHETTRVCDKRARMSPPPNAVGSNAIEIVAHETTRVCDKKARMSPPHNVGSNAIEIIEDETTRVCDKRARMSPPSNVVGSNAIELGIGGFSPRASVGVEGAKKKGRPVGSKNKKTYKGLAYEQFPWLR